MRLLVLASMLFSMAGRIWAQNEGNRAAEAVNQFGADLHSRIPGADQSLVYSPYSISSALGLLYAGAKGTTAAEIAMVMHWIGYPKLHPEMQALMETINGIGGKGAPVLKTANAIWPQEGAPILESYLSIARDNYHAEAKTQDYIRNAEGARMTINGWVSGQTAGKIPELLGRGSVGASTRLVLTNAVYFKGKWADKFLKESTRPETFTLLTGKTIETPMMHRTGSYLYGETADAQVLELPYDGKRLALMVVLPKTKTGLAATEGGLAQGALKKWSESLQDRKVQVSLPTFHAETSIAMNDVLKQMGMKQIFTDSADLSGINGRGSLTLSAVIHKAVIDVDEEGTEAAAATGGVVSLTSYMPSPTEIAVFRADHPFLYFLRDRMTRTVLFAGRVTKP